MNSYFFWLKMKSLAVFFQLRKEKWFMEVIFSSLGSVIALLFARAPVYQRNGTGYQRNGISEQCNVRSPTIRQ
jgi:hypothetical protein